jgi:proteasome lid subunit RPN8/RPN11
MSVPMYKNGKRINPDGTPYKDCVIVHVPQSTSTAPVSPGTDKPAYDESMSDKDFKQWCEAMRAKLRDEYDDSDPGDRCPEHLRSGATLIAEGDDPGDEAPAGRVWRYHSAQRASGKGQPYMELADLEVVDPTKSNWVMGQDGRVYGPKLGLIECLAPLPEPEEDGLVYVHKVDWDSFPPFEELAFLFDAFFAAYEDREVVMLVGRKRDGTGWRYHVPEQKGSSGSVSWVADDDEMGEFLGDAKWVGTIHIHPGLNAWPSGTDIDDWAEPEKSGLHLIFGQDGRYTVCGAISGKTFRLMQGEVAKVDRHEVEWTTSQDRPLEDILHKGTVSSTTKETRRVPVVTREMDTEAFGEGIEPTENDAQFVWTALEDISCKHGMDEDEMTHLLIVRHEGLTWILTQDEYLDLVDWCRDLCNPPPASRLRIKPKKGGK